MAESQPIHAHAAPPLPTSPCFKNIVGQRFGRIVITAYAGRTGKHNHTTWTARCDCGKQLIVRAGHVFQEVLK